MKSLANINKTLKAFEKKYGVDVTDTRQGSESWFTLKLGVLSASNASKIVAKKGTDRS